MILSAFLVLFSVGGCSTQVKFDYYKGEWLTDGLYPPKIECEIADTYEQAGNMTAPGKKKYLRDFFDDHILIVIKDYNVSRIDECEITSAVKKGRKLEVSLDIQYASELSDGTGKCNYIFLELNEKDIESIEIVRKEMY